MGLSKDRYEAARSWMYRNARPLHLARWEYHFEGGHREAVWKALSFYQNKDGGFGHALEADSWNPHSAPIQVAAAAERILEVGGLERTHPLVQGILDYLGSGAEFNGQVWANTISSNNEYPHAPWWQHDSRAGCNGYNPSAVLAGFILLYAEQGSRIQQLGMEVAAAAVGDLLNSGLTEDMHLTSCYLHLLECAEKSAVLLPFDTAALEGRLRKQINCCITKDKEAWENGYICTPSQFFNSRESRFYEENREMADYELEYIVRTQGEDGTWNIPWGWNAYPQEWAIAQNWWKAEKIILNLLYLKGFCAETDVL